MMEDVMSVTGTDVVEMARTQIGHYYSGEYDSLNGNHEWPWWCQSYTESTFRNLGLAVTPQNSALSASQAYELQQGRPPAGAAIYFYSPDGTWSSYGHTAISLGDGTCVGTVTDNRGVAISVWNELTHGFLGWVHHPEITEHELESAMPYAVRVPGNPYENAETPEIIVGGGFFRMWLSVGDDGMMVFGFPTGNEIQAMCTDPGQEPKQRTVQFFERTIMTHIPENDWPWDVVCAPRNQTVSPIAP
jgi:hypothetical protein